MSQESIVAARPERSIDWERVELDYRAGIKTIRQIGHEHGITHGAVLKRARRDGWTRDLSRRIQEKADALVAKAAVSTLVTKERLEAERLVVDANAQAVAEVRLQHRKDIGRARRVATSLLSELEEQAGPENAALLMRLGDALEADAEIGKMAEAYKKVISLPTRVKTLKDLGEALRVVVTLEREAFGMDEKDASSEKDSLTALLHRISSGSSSALMPVSDVETSATPLRAVNDGDADDV